LGLSPAEACLLDADDQRTLLDLARRCLEARVRRQSQPLIEYRGALDTYRGAFVSIHGAGDLRGCLGRLETDRTVADVVAHLATVVADSDPRFPPVTPEELPTLVIEISVLTPECEVTDVAEIEVGRHGLIIEQGSRRGLLLPQVATEYGWDRETFLDHTCVKAGLPPDAWRQGARVFRFEAQVFHENAHDDTQPS
jgi:AmmeMemoRadiSam system protein A